MKQNQVILTRIQTHSIKGFEKNIFSDLPIIKYSNKTGVVRDINWNIESGKGIQWINDEKEIENIESQTTAVISNKDIYIKPNQLPIIIGHSFIEATKELGYEEIVNTKDILDIQEGYKIFLKSPQAYEKIGKELFQFSKNIFEKELKDLGKTSISSRANSALELIVGNPFSSQKNVWLMLLTKDKIEYDSDLSLASIDLEKPKKEIKKDVNNYIMDL